VLASCLPASVTRRSRAVQLANVAPGILIGKRGTALAEESELLERMFEIRAVLCAVVHASQAAIQRSANAGGM
jgi:bifunctional ADP-heptose synthase (sugar kinase/adenylyltransferase)